MIGWLWFNLEEEQRLRGGLASSSRGAAVTGGAHNVVAMAKWAVAAALVGGRKETMAVG
jgi:hypothetical protein